MQTAVASNEVCKMIAECLLGLSLNKYIGEITGVRVLRSPRRKLASLPVGLPHLRLRRVSFAPHCLSTPLEHTFLRRQSPQNQPRLIPWPFTVMRHPH